MKAILVDLDGTLVRSHNANVAAYKAAIEEAGLSFDVLKLERTAGRLAWKPMLLEVVPDHEHLHLWIAQRKRQIYAELVWMVELNKTLLGFLQIHQGILPIGLVTSASRGSVDALLRAKSLDGLFSIIVTSDDVEKQKPDPEPYKRAALLLGVPASECIVLEDSDIGVESARLFGAQVWRVEW